MNHRAIYAAHPEIGAIVTAYPVNATAFSVTDAALDARTIPESYVFLRQVRRVPYGVQFGDGRELAERTTLRDPALILENDGVQVCGTSVLDAFDRLEVLESTAEAMINSRPIGDDGPDVRRGHRGAGGRVLQEAVIPVGVAIDRWREGRVAGRMRRGPDCRRTGSAGPGRCGRVGPRLAGGGRDSYHPRNRRADPGKS